MNYLELNTTLHHRDIIDAISNIIVDYNIYPQGRLEEGSDTQEDIDRFYETVYEQEIVDAYHVLKGFIKTDMRSKTKAVTNTADAIAMIGGYYLTRNFHMTIGSVAVAAIMAGFKILAIEGSPHVDICASAPPELI